MRLLSLAVFASLILGCGVRAQEPSDSVAYAVCKWSITPGTASSPRLRGEDRGEGAARLRGT